jgi:transcriptional regulator with XRE-family HTH domain
MCHDQPRDRARSAGASSSTGLSQAAVAGLVGRSESWLSQVERGLRTVDSYTVLRDLARVLRVDIVALTGSGKRTEPECPSLPVLEVALRSRARDRPIAANSSANSIRRRAMTR